MYCRHCGAEVGTDQRHCKRCGAKQFEGKDTDERLVSANNELAIITKIFIGICLFLMFLAGTKMLSDDNYVGLIYVILGFGFLIYGLFWMQNRQVSHQGKIKQDPEVKLNSEGEKLLASGGERFSVTEQSTRKFESARLGRKQ
jgi:hypothetical protein